jgi:hypothetical protein
MLLRALTSSRFAMDWANFALFAAAYLCRFRALTQASELIKTEGFPPSDQLFVSYDDPAFWIMMWKNIFAFNCIITWVKMLKHLGHIPVMTHIIKVMAHCLPGVLNFLFVFIFIFVGSSMAHLLAYGDSTYRFKDLPMSMYRYFQLLDSTYNSANLFRIQFHELARRVSVPLPCLHHTLTVVLNRVALQHVPQSLWRL